MLGSALKRTDEQEGKDGNDAPALVTRVPAAKEACVSDDVNPPLVAGEAAFFAGIGRHRQMPALKRAEPRAGLC